MLWLGGDVLGLVPCSPCWPPRPRKPAWACLGWGSTHKHDVAEPLCRPPSLTLGVHGASEGPAPRAQVSSLWALTCPLPDLFRSSWERRRSPLPLIPWRWHGSRSSEAQGEEAACYGWAVTFLGWRLVRHVGPRNPRPCLGLLGWGALVTWLALVACPRPWDDGLPSGSPRAGWDPPPPPASRATGWLPPCAAPPVGWGFCF